MRPLRAGGRVVPQRRHLQGAPPRVDRVAAVGLPVVRRPGGPPRQRAGPVLDTPTGPCRHCHSPISWQYPFVELATAGLFAGVAGRLGRYDWAVPAYLRPVRRAPRPVVDRRRTARAAQGDRLPAARPGRRPPPHGRRLDVPVARPLGCRSVRGRLVHGVLRFELHGARVRSASATSAWPRCSGWASAGWA